jgi:hypothetical protein
MKRLVFLAPFLAFTLLADDLPKAESILDRYLEVTGGKALYQKRKTEIATGTVELPSQGLKGTLTRYAAEPDKNYSVVELEGIGKIESGSVGGIAWDKNAITGPRVKTGEEKAQALREGTFNEHLNWRKNFAKAETAGVETVDGEECYKVVLTPPEGKPENVYYQKKSGLAVKATATVVSQMGEVPMEQTLSDYKDFGGILMPSKIHQKVAGQELLMTIQTVKVNEEIPASKFDPPADVKELLTKK